MGSVATLTENGDLAPGMLPLPCLADTGSVHPLGWPQQEACSRQPAAFRYTGAADVKKHNIH